MSNQPQEGQETQANQAQQEQPSVEQPTTTPATTETDKGKESTPGTGKPESGIAPASNM